jgi:hypothetical protein
LSPAYRRRIERGEARGLTRQQARGQSREAENSAIRRHAQKVTLKVPGYVEYEDIISDMKDWVKRNGFASFQKMLNIQREKQRQYKAGVKGGYNKMSAEEFADYLYDEFDGDPPNLEWVYYKS